MSAGLVEALLAGTLGLLIGAAGLFFQQRNRRHDDTESRLSRDTAARVADSKNALDAWISISAANTSQIASLTGRLDTMQKRVEACEDVIVPGLEATVAGQKTTIAALLARIEQLEQGKEAPT